VPRGTPESRRFADRVLAERYDFVTHAPITIEADVWIGAGATVTRAADRPRLVERRRI